MIVLTRILLADDFSETSAAATSYAAALARTFGAKLHVLHVMENYFMRPVVADPTELEAHARHRLHDRVAEWKRNGLDATGTLETSTRPADVILEYARNMKVDLIVIGTHGRQSFDRLLMGSVAEHVVRHAPCPVLTVRATGCPIDVCEVQAASEPSLTPKGASVARSRQ